MKKNTIQLWLLLLAAYGVTVHADTSLTTNTVCAKTNCPANCTTSNNTWLPRAFSSHQSREIMLEKTLFQVDGDRDEWNGTVAFATDYMQNFGSKCGGTNCKNLGAMPFWSGTNTMTVGNNGTGKDAAENVANLDAYQFGLGNIVRDSVTGKTINGTISLDAKVQHVGTDMLLYFTNKKDERGLFFKLHAPLGAMSINTRLKEVVEAEPDDQLFFSQTTSIIPNSTANNITYVWANASGPLVAAPLTNITQSFYPGLDRRYDNIVSAFAGGLGDDDSLNGNVAKPIGLLKGRITPCKQTAIRMGDISASLGYNLLANDKGILGIAFKAACPTGNVPTANYALEPIFGRAGAWAVGGEVMGHYKAWTNDADTKYLDVWLQGEVLHLLPGRTPNWRSFDLKANGAGSKYMLLQYYEGQSDNTRVASSVVQAINLTTLPVVSKFAVEGSVALMFDFHHNNWNLGVGGEFWGRSKENLAIDLCSAIDLRLQNLNDFAVVGRQVSAYDIQTVSTGAVPTTGSIAANLCEPAAQMGNCQDTVPLNYIAAAFSAPTATSTPALPKGIVDARVAANRIPADLDDALNICGAAAAKAYTGKVFGQLGYTWSECRYTPNLSVTGSAEFTNNTNNAVQLWSAGVQGSLNF